MKLISTTIPKRAKYVFTTIFLTFGFIAIQLTDNTLRLPATVFLGLITTGMFFWSLKEGLGRDATLVTLILPFFFTVSFGLFWFLLPTSLVARIPVIIFYAVGIYALALTSNIYTVGAIRTIALVRAAKGVGFVLTFFVSFLLFDTIFSLKKHFLVNAAIIYAVSFPLFLQGLWSVRLEKYLEKQVLFLSLLFSMSLAQIATLLYFWPVSVVTGSLFLTVAMYIMLGLGQSKLELRLFPQTVREYVTVGLLVFLVMFFVTRWGA